MTDELKHECAVAMVVLRRSRGDRPTSNFGGAKLSLLLEKQHNRGQDGAGAAILAADPEPGEEPYWIAKSASDTPLADVLGAIARRESARTSDFELQTPEVRCPKSEVFAGERIFLGHLRYATFGKNEVTFCHPFVHEASELEHTLLLAGNFNLTNAHELFEDYRRKGEFPTSRADGYLVCELIAHELGKKGLQTSDVRHRNDVEVGSPKSEVTNPPIAAALSTALAKADGAWTFCGATGDGWAFATRDPHGIRPGFYYVNDEVVAVASERPAIQAAFDAPPEVVKELPPGKALVVSPSGEVKFEKLDERREARDETIETPARLAPNVSRPHPLRPCSFERIYFSRANDAAIYRERKALGAALLPQILETAGADLSDIFFSYIPNSARIAFHGLLEAIFNRTLLRDDSRTSDFRLPTSIPEVRSLKSDVLPIVPRFGEVIVKDAKFRTFIADAAARREFYKHVYDVTYGLVRPGRDTLVVLDDSIVRGNTMKNAILPMLDRLGPKRIVIASSAPPIRYPDCYGIDMSTLGELVAFRALVNLLDGGGVGSRRPVGNTATNELREALAGRSPRDRRRLASCAGGGTPPAPVGRSPRDRRSPPDPLATLYARFTPEQHCTEIARLLTPPGMKAEVKVVYQTVKDLRRCLTSDFGHQTSTMEVRRPTSDVSNPRIGDWYFTGDYPTPGGYKVLRRALRNYLEQKSERPY